MSCILTVAVSDRVGSEKLNEIARKYNILLDAIKNKYVENQLPKKMAYYAMSWFECEYFIALEKNIYKKEKDSDNEDEIMPELLEWFGISRDYIFTPKEESDERKQAWNENVDNWLNFVKEMLLDEKIELIGYLMHGYTGTIEDEEIDITKNKQIHVDLLSLDDIENIELDVLYLVQKTRL